MPSHREFPLYRSRVTPTFRRDKLPSPYIMAEGRGKPGVYEILVTCFWHAKQGQTDMVGPYSRPCWEEAVAGLSLYEWKQAAVTSRGGFGDGKPPEILVAITEIELIASCSIRMCKQSSVGVCC